MEIEFWRREMMEGEDVYFTFCGNRCLVNIDGRVYEILINKDSLLDEYCHRLDGEPSDMKIGHYNNLPYLYK